MFVPNARFAAVAPATQVAASVVMCGCAVMTPFGWMLVWRPVVSSTQPASPSLESEAASAQTSERLAKLVSLN